MERDVDVFGIDLGTTKSVIAIWDAGSRKTRVLRSREGQVSIPSVVAFEHGTEEVIVGERAVVRMASQPTKVIYSVKRFIGRRAEEECVEYDRKRVVYDVNELGGQLVIQAGDRRMTPAEISSNVLRQLKKEAEIALRGHSVKQAVISVPAYFNDSQRRATKEAGEMAGLIVPRIIPEPTAAALAFGLGEKTETIAVYDLGGGTFDISILEIKSGLFRVKAIGGDTHLGGDDFDHAIIDWMRQEFERQHPKAILPVEEDADLRARLRTEAIRAKSELTEKRAVDIRLPELFVTEGESLSLIASLTREHFEYLIQPFIERTLTLMRETIRKSGVKPTDLSQILLVGGQTRTQMVQSSLWERFGRPINKSIEPEEAVARGAAVLGARLCGHLKEQVRLWDAIPLSLGIELADGTMAVVIPANTQIPIKQMRQGPQAFTTQRDGQASIRFKVYQGERPLAADNAYIGEVILPLTTSRRAGEHRVNCLFAVDHNGILTVRAESADTEGQPVEVVFAYGAMAPAEVERRLQEAAAHREADDRSLGIIRLRQELKELREGFGEHVTADLRSQADKITDLLDARDVDRARRELAALRKVID